MTKAVALILALASPFLFPSVLAVAVVFGASLVFPPAGLLAGVLADAAYRTPFVAVPYATLLGLLSTLVGYAVQHLIRTRIMGA